MMHPEHAPPLDPAIEDLAIRSLFQFPFFEALLADPPEDGAGPRDADDLVSPDPPLVETDGKRKKKKRIRYSLKFKVPTSPAL
jgi:hypothetical protein